MEDHSKFWEYRVLKAKNFNEMYEPKRKFPEQGGGGGGVQTQKPSLVEYGYFLENHIRVRV